MATHHGNELERQLSSVFRAEAQDLHLPLGTWQQIAPKMGDPDSRSLFWLLRNAVRNPLAEKVWRNPMKVKHVAIAATSVFAVIMALLFILFVNDGNDGDQPVPAVSPTAPAIPTEPLPTPDLEATVQHSARDATATADAQPTATAAPVAVTYPKIELPQLAPPDASNALPLPGEINPMSERQPNDVVVDVWTDYFAGNWVRIDGLVEASDHPGILSTDLDYGAIDLAFCEGGLGVILGVGSGQVTSDIGEVFYWEFKHSPANQWFAPALEVQMLNQLVPQLDFSYPNNPQPGAPRSFSFTVDGGKAMLFVYEASAYESAEATSVCDQIDSSFGTFPLIDRR